MLGNDNRGQPLEMATPSRSRCGWGAPTCATSRPPPDCRLDSLSRPSNLFGAPSSLDSCRTLCVASVLSVSLGPIRIGSRFVLAFWIAFDGPEPRRQTKQQQEYPKLRQSCARESTQSSGPSGLLEVATRNRSSGVLEAG